METLSAETLRCPYCGNGVRKTRTTEIYGERYDYGHVLVCLNFPACDAYVGVHKESGIPLGTLANKELRFLRSRAHALFDPLWQRKTMSRTEAYFMLQKILGISEDQAHIGMLDCGQCEKLIKALSPKEEKVHG
jgi:hypothetical protein